VVVAVSSEDALPYGVAGAIAVGARFSRVGLALSLRGSGRREPHNYLGVLRSWTVAPWVEGRRTRLAGRGGEGDRAAAVARRCWAPLSGGEGPGNEGIRKWMCAGFVEKGLPSCCPLPKLPIANWDCRRAKLAPNVSAVRVPTVDSDLSHVSSHSHHGNEQPPKCHSQGHGDIKDQHLRGGEGDGWDRARRGKREKAHLDSSETS
jgi:hypothetical protein